MKMVSMHVLKQELASIIAETAAGTDVLVTRHNKPVARLTRPETEHPRRGSRFGKASLKPAVRRSTAGRYLQFLKEDRRASLGCPCDRTPWQMLASRGPVALCYG